MNIATVERVGHWLVPVMFITIGTVILIESGVTARLLLAEDRYIAPGDSFLTDTPTTGTGAA